MQLRFQHLQSQNRRHMRDARNLVRVWQRGWWRNGLQLRIQDRVGANLCLHGEQMWRPLSRPPPPCTCGGRACPAGKSPAEPCESFAQDPQSHDYACGTCCCGTSTCQTGSCEGKANPSSCGCGSCHDESGHSCNAEGCPSGACECRGTGNCVGVLRPSEWAANSKTVDLVLDTNGAKVGTITFSWEEHRENFTAAGGYTITEYRLFKWEKGTKVAGYNL